MRFGGEQGEGGVAAIAFRQDDFVEQFDGRILSARGFALVDEFVEHLRLSQHVHVFRVAVRDALKEVVHVEVVDQAGFAGLARCRVEILAVGVEEGGEATDEGGADLVGAESVRADEADGRDASCVDCGCAGWDLLAKEMQQ